MDELLLFLLFVCWTFLLVYWSIEQNIQSNCRTNFEQKIPLSGERDKCFKYYTSFLKEKREKEKIKKELLGEKLLKENLSEEEIKLLKKLKDKGLVK